MVLLVSYGCSQEPVRSPAEAARMFFEAGNSGDPEQLQPILTKKAWESLNSGTEEGQGLSLSDRKYDEYTIGNTEIDGDAATVEVEAAEKGEKHQVNVMMQMEDEEWRDVPSEPLWMRMGEERKSCPKDRLITLRFRERKSFTRNTHPD